MGKLGLSGRIQGWFLLMPDAMRIRAFTNEGSGQQQSPHPISRLRDIVLCLLQYNPPMSSIFLVGFMGCGKTTVGRELAERLGWSFVDLDEEIAESEGRLIPEIFADGGEKAFRVAERHALEQAVSSTAAVIATGGGLFQFPENRLLIGNAGGWSVFLDVPWPILEERMAPGDGSRPMWSSAATARTLFEQRSESYQLADATVEVKNGQSAADVAEEIVLMRPELVCAI